MNSRDTPCTFLHGVSHGRVFFTPCTILVTEYSIFLPEEIIQRFMRRLWFSFVNAHLVVHLLCLVAYFALSALLSLVYLWGPDQTTFSRLDEGLKFLLGDRGPTSQFPGAQQVRAVFTALLFLGVTLWQAVFIYKIMTRNPDLRFSKNVAYCDEVDLGDHDVCCDDWLTIRIMNQGNETLYNICIQPSLRYFDPNDQIYLHFELAGRKLKFSAWPVGLPFRVLLKAGALSGLNHHLFDPFDKWSDQGKGDKHITLTKVKEIIEKFNLPKEHMALIVHITADDVSLGQTKKVVHEYPLHEIVRGQLCSLERTGKEKKSGRYQFFSKKEIRRAFDKIERST